MSVGRPVSLGTEVLDGKVVSLGKAVVLLDAVGVVLVLAELLPLLCTTRKAIRPPAISRATTTATMIGVRVAAGAGSRRAARATRSGRCRRTRRGAVGAGVGRLAVRTGLPVTRLPVLRICLRRLLAVTRLTRLLPVTRLTRLLPVTGLTGLLPVTRLTAGCCSIARLTGLLPVTGLTGLLPISTG